jgi:uncharacterized membrane protein
MMATEIVDILLWTAALSSGLIAGVYFTFSAFVMRAFGNIEASHSIAAMNAINKTILRSAFMPLFFGSTIISVLLMISAFFHWGAAGAEFMLMAGAIYFVSMFICTVLFNVPLNNSLAALEPDSANANQIWSRYLKTWTHWNHLRTLGSITTCILCVWILSNY